MTTQGTAASLANLADLPSLSDRGPRALVCEGTPYLELADADRVRLGKADMQAMAALRETRCPDDGLMLECNHALCRLHVMERVAAEYELLREAEAIQRSREATD